MVEECLYKGLLHGFHSILVRLVLCYVIIIAPRFIFEQVLAELGYSQKDITKLREKRVV